MKKSLLILILLLQPMLAVAGIGTTVAPDFSLNDAYGNSVSLREFRGKVVFINFWASWCAPCKKEFPELNALADRYDATELTVLAININKKRSHADEFINNFGTLSKNLVVLFDPDAVVIPEYKALAMPTSFVVDKSGIIRYMHFGFNRNAPAKWVAEVDGLIDETSAAGKLK